MKIEVGSYAGFCKGVKRAVNRAVSSAHEENSPIITDGELIHNPQTLQLLQRYKITPVKAEEGDYSVFKDKTAIIRAHGVPPERLKSIKSQASKLINLTCPDVAKVQGIIKKHNNKGLPVIIFGKEKHPEVIGLKGFADEAYVVYSMEDIEKLPQRLNGVLLVSQTTMDKGEFARIAEELAKRYEGTEVLNTICDATELRQNEAVEIAKRNDVVLVIGGKNSSNTRRLYEIASKETDTFFINETDDVRKIDFSKYKSVGITAGASTPDWLIEEVVEEVSSVAKPAPLRTLINGLHFLFYTNIFVSAGAFMLSFAVTDLISHSFPQVSFSFSVALLVSLYYMAMSLLNNYTAREVMRINDRARHKFIFSKKKVLPLMSALFLFSFTGIFYIIFSLENPTDVFMLTVFSIMLGIAYNLSYLPIPEKSARLFIFRFKNLPIFKSLIISVSVAILLNGFPVLRVPEFSFQSVQYLDITEHLSFIFSFFFIFYLMLTRQALLEIKSSQSDKIAGISGLADMFSNKQIRIALKLFSLALALSLTALCLTGKLPLSYLKYLIAILYNLFIIMLSSKKAAQRHRFSYALLLESNLFVTGMVSFINF